MTVVLSPGSPPFLSECWRVRPYIFRRFLGVTELTTFTKTRFRSWCEHEVPARLALRTERNAPGGASARLLQNPTQGLALYDHYAAAGEPITLLLNDLDTIDPSLTAVQSRFRVPFGWRRGHTVATLSAVNGGIGYHGGSEDGFIVQVAGERRWSVWSSDVLSAGYRRALCGDPADAPTDPRSKVPPLVTVTLAPGDALYVPALFPHEGTTLAESISLSFAWRGLSAYSVFEELHEASTGEAVPELPRDLVDALCVLLQDPPPGTDLHIFLREQLALHFAGIPPALRPAKKQVAVYVELLVAGEENRLSNSGSANLNTRA